MALRIPGFVIDSFLLLRKILQLRDSVIDSFPLLVIRDADLNSHVIVIGGVTVLTLE